jgi:hypothetical protein
VRSFVDRYQEHKPGAAWPSLGRGLVAFFTRERPPRRVELKSRFRFRYAWLSPALLSVVSWSGTGSAS